MSSVIVPVRSRFVRRERLAAQDGAGPAEEAGVPVVLPGHDEVEEHVLLAVQAPHAPAHAVLQRIQVVVPLRHLDERDLRVVEEAERPLQEVGTWHMVRIEGGDQVRVGLKKGVVPVAGLRVGVVGARDVLTAELGAEAAHRRSPAVVEDERAMRIAASGSRPGRSGAAGRCLRCMS